MDFTFTLGDIITICTLLAAIGVQWQRTNQLIKNDEKQDEKIDEIKTTVASIDKRVTILEVK